MVSTPTTLCRWCLSERRPLWPGWVVCFVLFWFVFSFPVRWGGRSQRRGNTGHGVGEGGRGVAGSPLGMEGGARWRFRERFIFTNGKTSLTVNHMQPQCAQLPPPSALCKRQQGAQRALRCIVGPVVYVGFFFFLLVFCLFPNKKGVLVDRMHSHLSRGAFQKKPKQKPVVVDL